MGGFADSYMALTPGRNESPANDENRFKSEHEKGSWKSYQQNKHDGASSDGKEIPEGLDTIRERFPWINEIEERYLDLARKHS